MRAVPQGIDLEKIADQPQVVDHAIGEFATPSPRRSASCSWSSSCRLGWRTGIVVALSVPLVLAITFIVMSIIDLDLHRITLGALIIALGLLVDDAIIAVEMMIVKMEQGWDRTRAASFAWTSTAFPMLTGTLVTAAGFLPIGFANSAVGEYAGGIFWVVAIALIASLVRGGVFTPYLGVKLLPDFRKVAAAHRDPHEIYETRLYSALRRRDRVVRAPPRHRRGWRRSASSPLPSSPSAACSSSSSRCRSGRSCSSRCACPKAPRSASTTETARKAEAMVEGDKDVTTYTTYIGQGSPRFWLGLNPQLPNEAFAEIVIVVEGRRGARAHQGAARKGGGGRRLAGGARARRPLQFRAAGRLPGAVPRRRPGRDGGARDRLPGARDHARRTANVDRPASRLERAPPSIRLDVDQDRARALGLTPQDVAQTLQTLISGVPVTDGPRRHREGRRWWRARCRRSGSISAASTTSPSFAERRRGAAVAGRARSNTADEEPILWRRNRDMSITVRADVVDGVQPPDVTNQIWPQLQAIRDRLEPGYRLEIGGAIEESEKGNASIFALFPADAHGDADDPDDPAAELLAADPGAAHRAARADRRVARAQPRQPAVRLRGAARPDRACRHDHAQRRDPGRSDRGRCARRPDPREAIVEATVRRARPVVLTALAAILAMIPLSRRRSGDRWRSPSWAVCSSRPS